MTLVVRLVSLLLTLVCLCVFTSGQTQTRTNAQTENATVTGKVSLKGKPASGVLVILSRSENAGNPYENASRGTTDQTGVYRISDLPPGSYQVRVLAPAYVIGDSGETRVRALVIGAGENIENINFSIVRGGVITGKVTDSEGRPVIEERVIAYRAEVFNNPQPRGVIPQSGSAVTDDRGIYRMYGVPAGQYKVAMGQGANTFSGSMAVGRANYQQTFHPNVSDNTKAIGVEVAEGSEVTGVDITVGPQIQTFKAAGRTVDGEKFTPVPNIRFGLQRVQGERVQFLSTLVSSNTQGDFLAEGLIPGKYRVFMMPEPNTGQRADAVEFEIVDHDVSGVTVKISKGAGLSGVLVLENEDKRGRAKFSDLTVSAYVPPQTGIGGSGRSASSTVSPDGSFYIAGLPAGTANMSVFTRFGQDHRWVISRIERDGVIQGRGIEVKDGETVGGVRVVVSYGTATLRGVINFSNDAPIKTGSVSLRLSKPGETSQAMPPTLVDPRGHFAAEGMVAGTYEIVVMYRVTGAQPRSHRQQVTLIDNTTTEVTITLDMSPGPKP